MHTSLRQAFSPTRLFPFWNIEWRSIIRGAEGLLSVERPVREILTSSDRISFLLFSKELIRRNKVSWHLRKTNSSSEVRKLIETLCEVSSQLKNPIKSFCVCLQRYMPLKNPQVTWKNIKRHLIGVTVLEFTTNATSCIRHFSVVGSIPA